MCTKEKGLNSRPPPLPPNAAVCAFKAVIDGKKTIKGIVREKGEAKQMYNEAVAQGKTAGLLEKEHAEGQVRVRAQFMNVLFALPCPWGQLIERP